MELVCQTAEHGYSVGDVAVIMAQDTIGAFNSDDKGVSIVTNTTNIVIRYGSDDNAFSIINKSNGEKEEMTNGNWQVRVTVMRLT
jgi:hypothetical protein